MKNIKTYIKQIILILEKKIIDTIDIFICVSQNTMEDLISFYNVNENKIHVISHGYEHLKNIQAQNLTESKIFEKPFI